MSPFSTSLKQLRHSKGFSSKKAFFRFVEAGLPDCPFNYAYYSRMEKGEQLPSPRIVQSLASLFSKEWADRLVTSYCASLFPAHGHLFPTSFEVEDSPAEDELQQITQGPYRSQQLLNEKQLALLAQTKSHYYLFLLNHMIDKPMSFEECKKTMGSFWKPRIANALKVEGLIRVEGRLFLPANFDLKLPKAMNPQVAQMYQKFDQWDRNFHSDMEFQTIKDKVIFRRVSRRTSKIIQHHIDLILEIMHSTEEVDPRYNDSVHFLNIRLLKSSF